MRKIDISTVMFFVGTLTLGWMLGQTAGPAPAMAATVEEECATWEYKREILDGEDSAEVSGWTPVGGSATGWDSSEFWVLLRRCVE
jgi:hypothetical protein